MSRTKNVSFFVFICAMIFAFIIFMTNIHLWGKDTSSRKTLFYKYLTLIFWMLRVAKYLVYHFTLLSNSSSLREVYKKNYFLWGNNYPKVHLTQNVTKVGYLRSKTGYLRTNYKVYYPDSSSPYLGLVLLNTFPDLEYLDANKIMDKVEISI